MGTPAGFTDTLYSQALQKLVVLQNKLLVQDRIVREAQSEQAARAAAFTFQQITSAAVAGLTQIANTGQDHVYSSCLITFSATSGAGKWRADGGIPTTTAGMDIPAGFYELRIQGIDNLRNFQMIATTATDLRASMTFFD